MSEKQHFRYVGALWKPADRKKIEWLLLDDEQNLHKVINFRLKDKVLLGEIEIDGVHINKRGRIEPNNDHALSRTIENYQRALKMFEQENPFEFKIDKGRILLSKFKQLPGMEIVTIPPFVTGFDRMDVFKDASELKEIKFTSYIYGMVDFVFSNTKMKEVTLSNFDMHYITSANNMFSNNRYLEKINFEAVTNAVNLETFDNGFDGCINLKSVNIENIQNLHKLKTINYMFNGCYSLQKIDTVHIDNAPIIEKFGFRG